MDTERGTGTRVERQQSAFCQAFPVRFLLIDTVKFAFESTRFGRLIFGSICHSTCIWPGFSNTMAEDRLCFVRRTFSCAESNAYIANTLNTLIFIGSCARFLFFVMCKQLD